MLVNDRQKLLFPSAVLLFALIAAVAWIGTGTTYFLAAALVGLTTAAVLAILGGRRLAGRLNEFEDGLRKSERMRLLGQVSGGLAHQIRSGVAAAKLGVQLHARSCEDGDAESLEVARRQLARVEADLSRFLDLGRDDVPLRPCHVVELVEESIHLLRPRCRHADVQLFWEPPGSDPVVHGDPGRLAHVIINLLTNAVEAAGTGGDVEVLVAETDTGHCAIEVWDSGPGPDESVAARLFQPFATGKVEGVGLGLFVARQATQAHGGWLDWRRERNRTCFRVELPAGHDAAARSPALAGDPSL